MSIYVNGYFEEFRNYLHNDAEFLNKIFLIIGLLLTNVLNHSEMN